MKKPLTKIHRSALAWFRPSEMAVNCWSMLGRIDLRFQSKSEEMRFKTSLEERLYLSTFTIGIIFIVGGTFYIFPDFQQELRREDGGWTLDFADPRTFRYVTTFFTFIYFPSITSTLMLLGWRFPRIRSCLGYLDIERLSVALVILPLVMLPFQNGWTAAKLYGQDPLDVWVKDMRGSDTAVALSVDAINTGLCLFMPVRVCLRWIPAVASVISFCIYASNWAPFPDHSPGNMFALFALTFCAMWGAWRNERDARQNFIAQGLVKRKSKELEVQRAGACRILDRLCDGLVELESDLHIRDPNPRFAALLLRPKQALQGTNFCDYLSTDDDRQRFVNALQGDNDISDYGDADKNGGMVQVCLRDASRDFTVYVYYARTFDATGACGYMVALVEAQERSPPPNALDVLDCLPLEVCSSRLPSTQSDPSESSLTSSELAKAENGCKEEAVAWIDINSDEMTILKCSLGFTAFGPIPEGSSLSNMVSRDIIGFRKWFQKAVNIQIHALRTPIEPCVVRLCTKQHAKIEFVTKCTPHFGMLQSDSVSEGNDGDAGALCLMFTDVRAAKRKNLSRHWHSPQRGGALALNRAALACEAAGFAPTLSL